MAVTPFPIQPELTAISIAYRNRSYIADEVAPRTRVALQQYKYWTYPTAETFAMPATYVGRKSRVPQVDLTATETTASAVDYGLEDPIPLSDIMNAPAGRSPLDLATMQLTDYILIGREKRVADMVFAAAAYPVGNKTQLAGNSQWSDFVNSDPIGIITAGIDACLVRPNRMVMSQAVWSKLRMHPKMVQAAGAGLPVTNGLLTRQAFADLFELDQIIVGQGWLNTAKKGQTATLSQIWGKHALLYHHNPLATAQTAGMTFAITAQWGERVATQRFDPDIGLRGSQVVRVGESLGEHIIAPLAAYFIQDAVA